MTRGAPTERRDKEVPLISTSVDLYSRLITLLGDKEVPLISTSVDAFGVRARRR